MSADRRDLSLQPKLSVGISVDVPTGSTIYDPAVLSLREDFKAKYEERKAKQQEQSPTNQVRLSSPLHITSPLPRQSLKLTGKADEPKEESEDLELGEDDHEREMCCNGCVPLYPFLIMMNVVKVVSWVKLVCFRLQS